MKTYKFVFNGWSKKYLPDTCKTLPKEFTLREIPKGAFTNTVMKRLLGAQDGTVVWIKKSKVSSFYSYAYGIKTIDLESRAAMKKKKAALKKKASQIQKLLTVLETHKVVKNYLKLKVRLHKIYFK